MAGKVAVIGGGVAGMSAAFSAAELGAKVTLFESTQLLGGRALGGAEFDTGRHLVTTAYRDFLWLTEKLGSRNTLHLRPQAYGAIAGRRRLWWRMGSPPGPAARLLGSPLLPAWERLPALLALARGVANAPGEPSDGELAGPGGCAPLREINATVAQLLSRWPTALAARFGEPVCRGTLNAAPADVSSGPYLNALARSLADRQRLAGWVRGNWGALLTDPAPAALDSAGIRVEIDTPIRGVRRQGGGWKLGGVDSGDLWDAVVTALPPNSLDCLRPVPEAAPLLELAANQRSNTIITVRARVQDVEAFPGPLAETEGDRAIWFAEPHPQGGVLVEGVISGRPDQPHPSVPQEREEFFRRLPGLFGQPVEATAEVRYTPSATPTLCPGCPRPTLRIADGLYYAGDWAATGLPSTLESAARSGRLAGRLAGGESV